MPNNVAKEWPVDNDGILWCEITQDAVNLTTGDIDVDAPVVGRTDVVAFFAASEELSTAVPIHADVSYALTNVAGTNRYYAYPQGGTMRSRLLPTYKDVKVYVHFVAGDLAGGNLDWHEVAETTIVNVNPAA